MTEVGRAKPDTTRASSRVAWVDVARIFAAFTIVVHHVLGGLFARDLLPEWLGSANESWDVNLRGAVPVFAFMSGVFALRTVRAPFGRFLDRLGRRVLWPLVVWSLISVTLSVVAGDRTQWELGFGDLLTLPWQPVLQLWYLHVLIVYLLVLWIVSRLRFGSVVLVVLAAASVVALAVGLDEGTYLPWRLASMAPYFVAGALLGEPLLHRVAELDVRIALGAATVASVVAVSLVVGLEDFVDDVWSAPLGLVPIVVVVMAARLAVAGGLGVDRLVWLGQRSLTIYVGHVIPAAAVRAGLLEVGIETWQIHLVLGVAAGLVVPIVLEQLSVRLRVPLFQLPNDRLRAAPGG